MSIKKSLAIAVSIFLMASGLDAAANPVHNLTKLLTAVRANNCESSVAVAARAEFIKLNEADLNQILTENPANIFATPYGFSLIHGWMLSKFSPHDLPFYINSKFSFDAYFRGMVDAIEKKNADLFVNPGYEPKSPTKDNKELKTREQAQQLSKNLLEKWKNASVAIEFDRWAYCKHMQYMHAAIMQARVVGDIPNMQVIIRSSFVKPVMGASQIKNPIGSAIAAGMASAFKGTPIPASSKKQPASPGNDHLADHFSHGATGTPVKE